MTVLDAYPWIKDRFCFIREEQNGAQVVCDCPLKNHRTSRLRLALGTDGRLLFQCFACGKARQLEILRAVGLTYKDCFPEGTKIERVHQECTAKYPYRDERGALLYMTLRLEPGRGGKDKEFVQRRLNPAFDGSRAYGPDNRRWINSLGDVRRVLYRLPELLKSDPRRPVFTVAGEKDAETLAALGLVATTNVCGESAGWLDSYSEALAGRHVVVIEDADETGARHANEVCGSLMRHARTVTRVRLPEKDSTAFVLKLQRGPGESLYEPVDVRREFVAECARAPLWCAGTVGNAWHELGA